MLFSPADAGLVAAWGPRGTPVVWPWREGDETRRASGSSGARPQERIPGAAPVECSPLPGAFSADGSLLLVAAPNGGVRGWRTGDLRQPLKIRPATACPEVLRVDPGGDRMLVASGNVATIFSVPGGRAEATLGGHRETITDAAFSPNGARVATAGADGARVWDERTGVELMALGGRGLGDQPAAVSTVAFTSDGGFAVTVDEDGVARLWDMTTRERLGRAFSGAVSTAFADDGSIVATLHDGRIVRVPQDGGARPVREGRLPGQIMDAESAPGAPGAVAAVSWRKGNPVVLLHEPGREKPRRLARGYYFQPSISRDGRAVAALSFRRLRVWRSDADDRSFKDVPLSRRELRAFDTGVDLSGDGRRVLITSYERDARIVDVDAGDSVRLVDESEPEIAQGDFSPDGKRLVTAGGRDAVLWDTGTGRVVRTLTGHGGEVESAVYSTPAGEHIATIDSKGIIRVYDSDGGEISTLPAGPGASFGLAFDSGSNAAVTHGPRGLELRRCEACQPADWLLERAQRRVTRTPAEIERIQSSAMSP